MFAVTVKLEITPEKMCAFLPLMMTNAATSRKEVGCRQFDVCTDPGKPAEVFLYEVYDDAAAFALHLASRHFLEFDSATQDMVAVKSVSTYGTVDA